MMVLLSPKWSPAYFEMERRLIDLKNHNTGCGYCCLLAVMAIVIVGNAYLPFICGVLKILIAIESSAIIKQRTYIPLQKHIINICMCAYMHAYCN